MIAEDTPAALKASLGGDWIDVVVRDADEPSAPPRRCCGACRTPSPRSTRSAAGQRARRDRMGALSAVVRELGELDAEDIALRRPTLDEVFLELTET